MWRVGRDWEGKREGRARANPALRPDAPTMRLHDGIADCEAETRPAWWSTVPPPGGRLLDAVEFAEDRLDLARRYADAMVDDTHLQLGWLPKDARPHL